jgi:hypothetical protein
MLSLEQKIQEKTFYIDEEKKVPDQPKPLPAISREFAYHPFRFFFLFYFF